MFSCLNFRLKTSCLFKSKSFWSRDAANVASLCGVRGDREAAGQAGLAGRGSSEGASSRRVDVADALQGLVVDASAAGDVVRQEDVLQGIQLERDGMK